MRTKRSASCRLDCTGSPSREVALKAVEPSFTIGPGFGPNPVFDTAKSFLEAAEASFFFEDAKKGFLHFKNWYVPHHLSVIATELFLKSLNTKVFHGPVTSADGPDDLSHEGAFGGHKAGLDALPIETAEDLRAYLSEKLLRLMNSLSNNQISRGRYPFEQEGETQRFPVDESEGRQVAYDWLCLAQALSKFRRGGQDKA